MIDKHVVDKVTGDINSQYLKQCHGFDNAFHATSTKPLLLFKKFIDLHTWLYHHLSWKTTHLWSDALL